MSRLFNNRPVGPNDKEHCHLPDYVVVDFLNLKLPSEIPPWDQNHKTVSLLRAFLLLNLISSYSLIFRDTTHVRVYVYLPDWEIFQNCKFPGEFDCHGFLVVRLLFWLLLIPLSCGFMCICHPHIMWCLFAANRIWC